MERARIGVIGSGVTSLSEDIKDIALEVGRLIAKNKAMLICGGLSGIMELCAKGVKEKNGLTIGILPTEDFKDANPYIDIPIVTGMGEVRNVLVVKNSDVLIAIGGMFGTLSEIGFALKLKKPVIGINTWNLVKNNKTVPGIISAKSPQEAITKALKAVNISEVKI